MTENLCNDYCIFIDTPHVAHSCRLELICQTFPSDWYSLLALCEKLKLDKLSTLLFPFLLLQLSAYGAELSSEACRELGFSSNLLCTSCDLLGEFSLAKLQPNCQQCCQQEALMEARKVKLPLADWP